MRKNKIAIKNIVILLVSFLLLLVVFVGLFIENEINIKKKKEDDKVKTIEKQVINGTSEKQGNFLVKDIKIEERGAENIVTGNVTNKSKDEKSITLNLRFTNSKKAMILGETFIDIDNLKPDEKRNFSLSITGSYANIDTYEVIVRNKK